MKVVEGYIVKFRLYRVFKNISCVLGGGPTTRMRVCYCSVCDRYFGHS